MVSILNTSTTLCHSRHHGVIPGVITASFLASSLWHSGVTKP
jgi:hypothetical protein